MKKIIVLLLITVMAVGLMAGCGSQEAGGEKGTVYVYCFGDYFDPELEYQFEEETGYDVVIDLFDTNEEMYPVIKTILPSMM